MPFEEETEEDYDDDIRLLFRSTEDCLVSGVLGGFAEYWNINSTIIRLLFLLSTILTFGIIIIVYFILAKVIPIEPK